MTMTLSEFKQMAQEKPVTLELLWRYGKTEFPPWMSGPRRIIAVRSYGFDLEIPTTEGLNNPEQKVSELRVERANLFEYSDGVLSIYNSGCRPATEAEQDVLDSWARKLEENPNTSYWAQKEFFRTFVSAKEKARTRRKGYEYLLHDRRREIDPKTGRELIFDKTCRGELALQYRVAA